MLVILPPQKMEDNHELEASQGKVVRPYLRNKIQTKELGCESNDRAWVNTWVQSPAKNKKENHYLKKSYLMSKLINCHSLLTFVFLLTCHLPVPYL
jgi:hypothetical protein